MTVTGAAKRVDDVERTIIMSDGKEIPIDDIIGIEGEIFSMIERNYLD